MILKRLLSAASGILAGLVVGAASGFAGPLASPSSFVDDRNGMSFTIELDSSAPDVGHFVFRVPARGFYVGEAAGSIRVLSSSSTVVDFRGTAQLRPAVDSAGNITGTVTETTNVDIRLFSHIDPLHGAAVATVTDGKRALVVVAATGRANPSLTLGPIEDAVVRNDPASMYPLMSGDITSRYTQDGFSQLYTSQAAATNRVTALRRLSVTDAQTNAHGLTYTVATYDADYVTPSATTGTTRFEVFLVLDGGSWRVAFTRQP